MMAMKMPVVTQNRRSMREIRSDTMIDEMNILETIFTYDTAGNIATKKDPNLNTWTNTWDNLRRLTQRQAPSPLNYKVKRNYDGNGNRTKIEIENIDKEILGPILNHYHEHDDVRILVLPDHPTPIALRTHTSEPVGFVMYGKGIAHDGSDVFTEAACQEKGLKFDSGEALMEHFMRKFIA